METRAERRRRERRMAKIEARIERQAVFSHQTGRKEYPVEDVAKALGLTVPEVLMALALAGLGGTVRAVNVNQLEAIH